MNPEKDADITITVFSLRTVHEVGLLFFKHFDIDVVHDPPTHEPSSAVSMSSAPRDRWHISMARREEKP